MFRVEFCRFTRMMVSVSVISMRRMHMMGGLLMIAGLIMLLLRGDVSLRARDALRRAFGVHEPVVAGIWVLTSRM